MLRAKAPTIFAVYELAGGAAAAYGDGSTKGLKPESVAGRRLAQPVVETVDIAKVMKWAGEDAARVMRVMISRDAFESVMLPGELAGGLQLAPCRMVRLNARRLQEMRQLRYLRPLWRVAGGY